MSDVCPIRRQTTQRRSWVVNITPTWSVECLTSVYTVRKRAMFCWPGVSVQWPTWRKILFLCFYFNSVHVSTNIVLIIRRINCINTTSGTCHSDASSMEVGKFLPDLHTRRSPTQSDTCQILHWYNWFSWWWARGCSKHVENWNKHIEKGIVCQVGHLQECVRVFAHKATI
jgi:hypothetical protein